MLKEIRHHFFMLIHFYINIYKNKFCKRTKVLSSHGDADGPIWPIVILTVG